MASAEVIPAWDFGFFQVNMIGYQAQVIPAILAVIAAHFVLGPIGWKIGSAISAVVSAGITGSFRVLFGAVFGFVYAPLVITGLHHMTNAIDMQLVADFGGTMLWPMIALSNIAQGSAVLGMAYLQRRNARAQEVNVPSCMQIKLKQGFGRAIRNETDACVVAILDERATPGQRHFEAMRAALPEIQVTSSLEDVVEFIYRIKDAGYFKEGDS